MPNPTPDRMPDTITDAAPVSDRPLAVYIHWPFCKAKCPYCDFNSHVREHIPQDTWKEALLEELGFMAGHVPGRRVGSIFFGGGTPSLMPPGTAGALIGRIHALWPVANGVEITLEANPTSVEASLLADFKAAGVNRISLGVQSLRDEALRFLGRQHSAREALAAVEQARLLFDRYSFDLIYARPGQTAGDWEKELAEALRHAGSHLSLYQLTIEEHTAFHHAYAKGGFALPGEAESAALYRLTEAMLADRGLYAYEVSNYAAAGQESLHNLAYWQGDEYVGVGPGAHGRLNAGGRRVATQTVKSPERWLECVQRQGHGLEIWQPLDERQDAEERLMMGLRLAEGIDYDAFERRAGFSLAPYINEGKRLFCIQQGLLADDRSRLKATMEGKLVLNSLTAELLA